MPWRETHDAYKIWVSEIILQQTRVEQGTNYYFRFIEKFPDVFKLAGSHQDAVMKLWQGLGYYSRAINMHTAAKQICKDFNGKIPDTFEEIIKIKGIGHYTAAAVLSFAYNKPYPVADGNVKRFISRYCGFTETLNSTTLYNNIQGFLEKEIAGTSARLFNQAIMEFGALYCKKSKPDCQHCIFIKDCFAIKNHMVDKLPTTVRKNTVKERFFIYLDIRKKQENGHYVLIRKRGADDIWRNLMSFI